MARLNQEVKRRIVERLACFEEPTAVAQLVQQEFGVSVTRQQVYSYDPTRAANEGKLAKELKGLFEKTRKAFTEKTEGIGVSHKSFRLQQLQRMAEKAEGMGNLKLAADFLEQAAKEMGEVYTNRTRQEVTGKDGGPVQQEVHDPYAAERERARERNERIALLKGRIRR